MLRGPNLLTESVLQCTNQKGLVNAVTVQSVTLAGKRFVIVSEKDFERLRRKAEYLAEQERGDVAEAKRRKGRGPARSYSELRNKLGLA